jgi:hypothetical protein
MQKCYPILNLLHVDNNFDVSLYKIIEICTNIPVIIYVLE